MGFLNKTVDKIFSNPAIFNFVRDILENDFKVPKKLISKELDRDKLTLDVGCGTGLFSTLFDPEKYYGIDISEKYISHAKKNQSGNFSVMDAMKMSFKDNKFDNVLIMGVLHHLDGNSSDKILREVRRVAKKGAKIFIMEDIPTKSSVNLMGKVVQYFDGGSEIRRTDKYKDMLLKHFTIKKVFETISGVCDYCVFILEK